MPIMVLCASSVVEDHTLLSFFVPLQKGQVDPSGFEPEASRVQGGRSTRLIYGPAPESGKASTPPEFW